MRFTWSRAMLAAAMMVGVMAPSVNPTAARTTPKPVDALAPSPLPTPAMTKSDIDAWLDGYMPYALKRGDAAGAVVVVVKDGKVLTTISSSETTSADCAWAGLRLTSIDSAVPAYHPD